MPRKAVAKFTLEHLQILDENAKVDAKLDPGLSDEQMLTMYRWMVLARELDERMLKLQRQGRLRPCRCHSRWPCSGTTGSWAPSANWAAAWCAASP